MDFHGMWGMGKMLRDTGAFFMRRSYNDDSLYWTTFKQYVYQLVTKGDVPLEFFIEGTRSRSNKSISPKYGLITMVLKAFFFSEVYDILFVPGFFKSLTILSENFGDIYAHFNRPISAREFFGDKLDRSVHSLKPLHMQEVTEQEKLLIPSLAHEIVYRQQKSNVITVFNLLSLILNHNLTKRKEPLTVTELIGEVNWFKGDNGEFRCVRVYRRHRKSIRDSFTAHKNLIGIEQDRVCLIENFIALDKMSPSRLKGHSLSEKTMSHSVPFVMLQIYVNPTLHYLIDAAVVVLILSCKTRLSEEELFNNYHFIRSLFSTEFVTFPPREKMEFDTALQHSINLGLINYMSDGHYECGPNDKLQDILISIIEPFTLTYFVVLYVLERAPLLIEEKTIIVSVQKILEEKINSRATFVHPYCLNLDTLNNCLNSLSSTRVVKKSTSTNKAIYETKRELVTEIKNNLGVYIPKCHIEEISITPVHFQNKL
ncbi:hypothetical protein NQ318_005300 [Aromia moschata]|uniref:Dihydroxyacetone phosphate acyltransferase n=1 Tax=Aromia moschata TaxID=1265417 RepID=A0AAV8XUS3_9CUCU|nr:hypothetical protein NQ318_005300 [Aromia moschata]